MDRAPAAPTPLQPFVPAPAVRDGIAAFAAEVNAGDPFVAAFANSLTAMIVSDPTLPDNPIVYVNPAFEALTGYAASEVVGRNCRFMQGPLTDAADVARMRDAIAARTRTTLDLLNHRRDGTPFWNRLMIAPVFDDRGAARWFVASQLDVTVERHRLAQVQQHRDALEVEVTQRQNTLALALKAGGLGTWAFDPATQELIASDSCKAAFGRTPDQSFTYAEFVSAVHPDDRARVEAAIGDTATQGVPYRIEYRILTPAGEQRWIGVRGELQRGTDGPDGGGAAVMSGFVTDISDRKFAEEHRGVLARELTHRVKNTLATVSAVVSQTLRDAASLADARRTIAGRIASLGTAHELLVEEEVEGAAIGDIVSRVLAPFADSAGERFTVEGPAIRLSPEITLALSMALYELATNAIKYGALSLPEGRVAIRWALSDGDAGEDDGRDRAGERRFCFSWVETGGPPVETPTRTGFGTRMIERVFAAHVRGSAAISYPRDGARFEIEAPI